MTFDHPNWGSEWRQRDFQFVTSEAFRTLLRENNVKLVTWREVGKLMKNPKTKDAAVLLLNGLHWDRGRPARLSLALKLLSETGQ